METGSQRGFDTIITAVNRQLVARSRLVEIAVWFDRHVHTERDEEHERIYLDSQRTNSASGGICHSE